MTNARAEAAANSRSAAFTPDRRPATTETREENNPEGRRAKKPRCNRDLLEICKSNPETITPEEIEQLHKDQPGPALKYLRDRLTPAQFNACIQHSCSAIEYVGDELNPEQLTAAFKGAPAIAIQFYPEKFASEEITRFLQQHPQARLTIQVPLPEKLASNLLGRILEFPSTLQEILKRSVAASI